MLNNITTDHLSLAISILALGASIYSIIKTNRVNRFELLVRKPKVYKYGDRYRLSFYLFNNSLRPIVIKELFFTDPKSKEIIQLLEFDVQAYYSKLKSVEINDDLNDPWNAALKSYNLIDFMPNIVQSVEKPSESFDFVINPTVAKYLTYYLTEAPKEIELTIKANEKLSFRSKTKTYLLFPTYSIQNDEI